MTNFSERKLNPSPSATFRRSSGGISRIMEPNSFNVTNWEGETLAAPSFGNCKRAAKTPLARAYVEADKARTACLGGFLEAIAPCTANDRN
ncbi:MAG TPA: hypothetical protein VN715_21835 [Roseiarcus sp.]|nr:hypothetical protein [Roseiarcus sp.]